jgi:hypothetical protein
MGINQEEVKISKLPTLMALSNISKEPKEKNIYQLNPPEKIIKRPKELERFDKTLPCILESNNSEDGIKPYNQFFNSINPEDINYYQFDRIDASINQSELSSSKINDFNISLGFPVFSGLDLEAKFGYGKSNKDSLNSKKINIKRYFYKIEINPEKISISPFYKKKIENIANNAHLNNEKKAEELYDLLKGIGIFVPLAAYIGGSKVFSTEKISNEKANKFELEFKAEFGDLKNSEEIKRKLEGTKTLENIIYNSIGGDNTSKNFKDWIENAKLENSDIIGYDKLKTIDYFISDNIQNILKEPIKLIRDKYIQKGIYLQVKENKKYYNIYSEMNKDIKETVTQRGICNDNLYLGPTKNEKIVELTKKSSFPFTYKTNGNERIFGFEIIKEFNNEKVSFTIKDDPLLTEYLKLDFKADKINKKDNNKYTICIYTMKIPDEKFVSQGPQNPNCQNNAEGYKSRLEYLPQSGYPQQPGYSQQPKNTQQTGYGKAIPDSSHEHGLTKCSSYDECKICQKQIGGNPAYVCHECDLVLCCGCGGAIFFGNKAKQLHPHPLALKVRKCWKCDICNLHFKGVASFYCSYCDFDVCSKCYVGL